MAYASKDQLYAALTSNRYKWPKHWQVTIDKLTQCQNPDTFAMQYMVRPINPEYTEWYEVNSAMRASNLPLPATPLPVAPQRYLDRIVFDSIDELDTWAYTVWRMMK
jgi:hypothetical protein